MNILITGGNGFIGRNIIAFLKPIYKIYFPSHYELDILNLNVLKDFILDNNIDIVIHTAIVGGKRTDINNIDSFYQNIQMWLNILNTTKTCKLVINFGSGAEFDKSKSINEAKSNDIFNILPTDYYGLVKNLIARSIYVTRNAISLRIFGCFGIDEESSRFITTILQNNKAVIKEDIFFDFFYIEDLCRVVQFYIDNINFFHKSINCVYKQKYRLSDITRKLGIQNLDILSVNGNNYTGSAQCLQNLNVPLLGLDYGLHKMKESLCQQR